MVAYGFAAAIFHNTAGYLLGAHKMAVGPLVVGFEHYHVVSPHERCLALPIRWTNMGRHRSDAYPGEHLPVLC